MRSKNFERNQFFFQLADGLGIWYLNLHSSKMNHIQINISDGLRVGQVFADIMYSSKLQLFGLSKWSVTLSMFILICTLELK